MMFSFTIPARPRKLGGKPRPVTWQRTNHYAGKRLTDKAQRAEKGRIASIARRAVPRGWPLDAAYVVEVIGYWPDRVFGDTDRLVSLPMDALEGVAYRTDRQVVAVAGGRDVDPENPRTEVTVAVVDETERAEITIAIRRREAA